MIVAEVIQRLVQIAQLFSGIIELGQLLRRHPLFDPLGPVAVSILAFLSSHGCKIFSPVHVLPMPPVEFIHVDFQWLYHSAIVEGVQVI